MKKLAKIAITVALAGAVAFGAYIGFGGRNRDDRYENRYIDTNRNGLFDYYQRANVKEGTAISRPLPREMTESEVREYNIMVEEKNPGKLVLVRE